MMTCQKLAELLLDFISGELQPEYCAEISEHLSVCSHCDAFVHSYRVTITLTRQLPPRQLRSDFAERLENLLRQLED
jgi:anti-sigma factor RsiW